jgi:transcriptional regulator with XRE-family HTH domain
MQKRKRGQKIFAGELDKFIGNQLMAKRKLLNLHQEHIAEEIGVSLQQYQKYESGKDMLKISTLLKIFRALEMTQNQKADFLKLVDKQEQEIENKNNASEILKK